MTALVAHSPVFRLNWPRIGAWSGTLSLHTAVIALLLMPPVAMQLMRHAEPEQVVVRFIEPEKIVPLPPDPPKPIERPKPAPPRPHVQPRIETVAPPVETTERTPMSYDAHDSGPPAPGPAATVPDAAPSALAYAGRTKVPYPIEAVRRGEHGTVMLRVLVGPDGAVQAVEIEKTSGSPRLDNAAREAVRQWTFHPGTRNGMAQSAWALIPIAFDLTQL